MSELHAPVDPVPSVRTPGDSWDITESVGATALGVAAARAAETAQPDPLVRDPFAYLLVCAAGPAWAELASGSSPRYGSPSCSDDQRGGREEQDRVGELIDEMSRSYQAVRTHFFDEFFGAASRDGVRQVVILAAGLDSRAFRLDWPAGTVVFEIDQPEVLAYKGATPAGPAAPPAELIVESVSSALLSAQRR